MFQNTPNKLFLIKINSKSGIQLVRIGLKQLPAIITGNHIILNKINKNIIKEEHMVLLLCMMLLIDYHLKM